MALKHLLNQALLVSAMAGGLAGCSNSIPDVIKIGAAQPLTGNKAGQGQDLLNGVKLAVDQSAAAFGPPLQTRPQVPVVADLRGG